MYSIKIFEFDTNWGVYIWKFVLKGNFKKKQKEPTKDLRVEVVSYVKVKETGVVYKVVKIDRKSKNFDKNKSNFSKIVHILTIKEASLEFVAGSSSTGYRFPPLRLRKNSLFTAKSVNKYLKQLETCLLTMKMERK